MVTSLHLHSRGRLCHPSSDATTPEPRANSQKPILLEIRYRLYYYIHFMLLTLSNMAMCEQTMAMRVFTRRQTGT